MYILGMTGSRNAGPSPGKPRTYVPAGPSARAQLLRLRPARSQVRSASRKSRCTTKWSAASSSRAPAAAGDRTTRTVSLLLRAPPAPLSGAAAVDGSLFIAAWFEACLHRRPRGPAPGSRRALFGPGEVGSPQSLVHHPPRGRVLDRKRKGRFLRLQLGSPGTWGTSFHRCAERLRASVPGLASRSPQRVRMHLSPGRVRAYAPSEDRATHPRNKRCVSCSRGFAAWFWRCAGLWEL